MLTSLGYTGFEMLTNDPPYEACNIDILGLAIRYKLTPFVKANMKSNIRDRQGRPLLHYLFGPLEEFSFQLFESVAKLLHQSGP